MLHAHLPLGVVGRYENAIGIDSDVGAVFFRRADQTERCICSKSVLT